MPTAPSKWPSNSKAWDLKSYLLWSFLLPEVELPRQDGELVGLVVHAAVGGRQDVPLVQHAPAANVPEDEELHRDLPCERVNE